MKKHEQIAYLASAGGVKTFVIFCCHRCGTKYSEQASFVYLAARKAVTAGWCVKDLGDILCPKCAGKQP